MSKHLSGTIRILPDVLFQEVRGETVLLNLDNERYFGLDEVGTRFLQLVQQESNLQAIFRTMLEEYEVEAEQLERDLGKLMDEMIEAGLISVTTED